MHQAYVASMSAPPVTISYFAMSPGKKLLNNWKFMQGMVAASRSFNFFYFPSVPCWGFFVFSFWPFVVIYSFFLFLPLPCLEGPVPPDMKYCVCNWFLVTVHLWGPKVISREKEEKEVKGVQCGRNASQTIRRKCAGLRKFWRLNRDSVALSLSKRSDIVERRHVHVPCHPHSLWEKVPPRQTKAEGSECTRRKTHVSPLLFSAESCRCNGRKLTVPGICPAAAGGC